MTTMEQTSAGPARPTPTRIELEFRPGDFTSLAEALDYAAGGTTGLNFYDGKGRLEAVLPYPDLRQAAREHAQRLLALGLGHGARIALVAETTAEFVTLFFAAQYARMIPVPLPVPLGLGKRELYVRQLRNLLQSAEPEVLVAGRSLIGLVRQAANGLRLRFTGTPEGFVELPRAEGLLEPSQPDDIAYIQYTSGSTQMPRGVLVTQRAVLANLQGIIQHGVRVRDGDRMVSWLPFCHDMGLIGLVLGPVAAQRSVDYLATSTFAMRPRLWLELMSRTEATISFSPPFGYELCARRVGPIDVGRYDLSRWRVAGVGAEMIRSDTLEQFAEALAPAGFRKQAFVPCYGMAEHSLAITFAPLGEGVSVDHIDRNAYAEEGVAPAADPARCEGPVRSFVDCGVPLPGHEIQVRDECGGELAERQIGTVFVRGPSLMSGYFNRSETSAATLSAEGWLDTGDMGYRIGDRLVVTGRSKDMIVVHGRNIWPQDLEYVAEQQPDVRTNDALAFNVSADGFTDVVVIIIQYREKDEGKRATLIANVRNTVRAEFGVDCQVVLVPPHTLPRTTSGKLSRSRARVEFLDSQTWQQFKASAA